MTPALSPAKRYCITDQEGQQEQRQDRPLHADSGCAQRGVFVVDAGDRHDNDARHQQYQRQHVLQQETRRVRSVVFHQQPQHHPQAEVPFFGIRGKLVHLLKDIAHRDQRHHPAGAQQRHHRVRSEKVAVNLR